jgi:hypothetical protein
MKRRFVGNYEVVPTGWKVKKLGAARASKVTQTEAAAISKAHSLNRERGKKK